MTNLLSETRAAGQDHSIRAHIRLLIALTLVLGLAIFGWGWNTSFAGAIIATGRVVVDGNTKKIQHLTGGTIETINVREGDAVKDGEILAKLSGTVVQANLSIIENNLAQLYLRRARLHAESSGDSSFDLPDNINGFAATTTVASLYASEKSLFNSRLNALAGMKAQMQSQIDQLKEEAGGYSAQIQAIDDELKLVDEETAKIATLYQKGLTTLQRLNLLKRTTVELKGQRGQQVSLRAQANAKLSELTLQLLQLDANRQSEVSKDFVDVEASIAEYEERRAAAKDQLDRLEIRSPIAGRVYQMTVHNINAVVQPGEVLMTVVPEDSALYVEARVPPQDIDQVFVDQPVDIRFTAFDRANTPDVRGRVAVVAPDLVSDERTGTTYYSLQIKLSDTKRKGIDLYPGMPAEVFIKTKERNVLSYIVKPFRERLRHTFRDG